MGTYISLQEVTPNIYDVFQQSCWWKVYRCSVPNEMAHLRPYFCMLVPLSCIIFLSCFNLKMGCLSQLGPMSSHSHANRCICYGVGLRMYLLIINLCCFTVPQCTSRYRPMNAMRPLLHVCNLFDF